MINPINPDKVAEQPGLLPYAHTAGGAVIKVDDVREIRSKNLAAMREGVSRQLQQLQGQMAILVQQAKDLERRREISERIYNAQLGYEPIQGKEYYLYEKEDGRDIVSMISPEEWGDRRYRYARYIAKIVLGYDNTWNVEKE